MPAKSKDSEVTESASTEVEVMPASVVRSDDDLASITSYADLAGEAAVVATDFGTGFQLLDKNQKRQLVGIDFAIVAWKFSDGDFGTMVTLHLITVDGRKYIINDGSTGIRDQMVSLVKRIPEGTRAIRVPHGLTVSDYTYKDEKTGEDRPASTFYLTI